MQKKCIRRFWIVLPILIAIIFFIIAPRVKSPPQKVADIERAVRARVITVPKIPIVVRAVGYGTTEPARTWEAVAEVFGQVIWLSEELKNGKIVAQGTELLRIDDSSYQLALIQVETQLNTLDVKDKITRASLALEERSQSLLKKDIERKRELSKQGTISSSILEEAERNMLKGEATVQNLKNNLDINAAERKGLNTQKDIAKLELLRTRVVAPFDVRIADLKVNQAQYVNKGQLLFSADGIDSAEIEARFPIGKLRPLITGKTPAEGEKGNASALEKIPGAMGLDTVVRLKTATHTIEWKARVDRVAGVVDPQTQTMGVVVVVDKPYLQARPGQRPALIRNTFVEVELRKKPRDKSIVIPSSAIHDGKVYVMDKENRMEIRSVKTAFIQGSSAVISIGLEEGETLVVTDLIPAVEGMLLDPVVDEKVVKRLNMDATGRKGNNE
jgi:multidrug efflux system membrane fusion protein